MNKKVTTDAPAGADTAAYVVQPGHSVRSNRASNLEGATVHLTARDGTRLETQGRVKRADNVGRQGAIANTAKAEADKAKAEAAKLTAGTVAELDEAISTMDETTMAALEKAEKAGKDRQGVADAIARRRAELAAEAEKAAGEGAE